MPKLTSRQLEVIDLAHQGLQQTEIAEALDISPRQVHRVLADARRAVGAKSNHELIAIAIKRRLIKRSS